MSAWLLLETFATVEANHWRRRKRRGRGRARGRGRGARSVDYPEEVERSSGHGLTELGNATGQVLDHNELVRCAYFIVRMIRLAALQYCA